MASGEPKAVSSTDHHERTEDAVLARVLEVHPRGVTADELINDASIAAAAGGSIALVQEAIQSLSGAGLLLVDDAGGVLATPAAVHYNELLEV